MTFTSLFRATAIAGALSIGLLLTGLPAASAAAGSSMTVDLQVSADGGQSWTEVTGGTNADAPTVLTGSGLAFRVNVTDTGDDDITDVAVALADQPGLSGFTFDGLASTDLAAGQSVISDVIRGTAAHSTTVAATATAFSSSDAGTSPDLSSSDEASYVTETPSLSIDKQISIDGGDTWLEHGNGILSPLPTVPVGSELVERVVVTNTGPVDLTDLSVTDAGGNGPADFDFSGASVDSLAVGATLTSDDASFAAASGDELDTATASAQATDGFGNTQQVIATDQADYQGVGVLSITPVQDFAVDATGPAGAIVDYTPPVVKDSASWQTKATCAPASGTLLAIGSTQVTCIAVDSNDIPSTVSTTFTVTVKGAAEQLTDLADLTSEVGPGTSLADKVQEAQGFVAVGDTPDACVVLAEFVGEVSAQSSKHIIETQATALRRDATRIEAVLGCG